MQRLDDPGPEGIDGFERKRKQGVFGLAFDASPHYAATFAAVRPRSGHKDEGHLVIQADESLRGGECDVVSDPRVVRFVHTRGRDADAEKAGVEASELAFHLRVVKEVFSNDLFELRVLRAGGSAPDRLHQLNIWVAKAFAQNALTDHSRGAEKNDVHDVYPMHRAMIMVPENSASSLFILATPWCDRSSWKSITKSKRRKRD